MKEPDRLTLEEKVGQLFWIGFQGPEPDAQARAVIQAVRPGGFILSQRNIESFDQFCALTGSLGEGATVAPLAGMVQEGGQSDRLKQLFAPLPSMREAAAEGTAAVRSLAHIIASELQLCGLNTGFSPVLDLLTPGSVMRDRAIAASAGEVTNLGKMFVDTLWGCGILPCAKHFPGLGSALMDPHFVLPRIHKTKKSLLLDDALPFLNLIDDVPMIMVGHAHYPALAAGPSGNGDEKPLPASLTPRIVGGLLRRKFGFEGVIVTDDLTMGAVHSVGLTSDIFTQAFLAGNDMMLFSQSTPLVEHGFQALVRAARGSEALRQRVDQSVARIVAMKRRFNAEPIRFRSQQRTRILRQIERLRGTLRAAPAEVPGVAGRGE